MKSQEPESSIENVSELHYKILYYTAIYKNTYENTYKNTKMFLNYNHIVMVIYKK